MENEKLTWRNLKNNCCPKCEFRLRYDTSLESYVCPNERCTFKCSEEVFNRIIGNMYSTKPKIEKDEYLKNSEYLNNL